jgi:hypothetical protein
MRKSENSHSELSPSSGGEKATPASEHVIVVKPSRKRGATGPRTPQGKESSKRNALKHGIFSQVALLKNESRAELDALWNGLREHLQPEGTLEEMLVEKLAVIAWQQRRLLIAQTAETQRSIESVVWNEVERQAEGPTKISEYSIRQEDGLIRRIANAEVLKECLELLKRLRDGIEENGFNPKWDSVILTKLYGGASRDNWQRTLLDSYQAWLRTAECSDEERQQHDYATPANCKKNFLEDIDDEIERLERYNRTHSRIVAEQKNLEERRQHVPLTPQFDHFVRYGASLERNFDRTLSQLERCQRMRLGEPVLPKLEVHHSLS